MTQSQNKFSHDYYSQILILALKSGYKFYTLSEFIDDGCPNVGAFIVRHDLDAKPRSFLPLLEIEEGLNVRSTNYIRITTNDYNLFDYITFPLIKEAEHRGFEIGLHTNFLEFATINGEDPFNVLRFETHALRSFFKNKSLAPHRDLNCIYNSLPWLEKNWSDVWGELGYDFHAYDKRIINSVLYVNEGYNPHLCWRNMTPEDAIATGKSICLLTHPHLWWEKHPFEHGVG